MHSVGNDSGEKWSSSLYHSVCVINKLFQISLLLTLSWFRAL